MSEPLNLMFVFNCTFPAESESEGRKKLSPVLDQCMEFKKAMGLLIFIDEPIYYDDLCSSRVIFNVKGSQDSILVKVSALFAFAASIKLTLIDQEFLTK